jgi:hypothetical protein
MVKRIKRFIFGGLPTVEEMKYRTKAPEPFNIKPYIRYGISCIVAVQAFSALGKALRGAGIRSYPYRNFYKCKCNVITGLVIT